MMDLVDWLTVYDVSGRIVYDGLESEAPERFDRLIPDARRGVVLHWLPAEEGK